MKSEKWLKRDEEHCKRYGEAVQENAVENAR